ncbi:MAG: YfhL family 4Fe-4S dicluster ferredoxin [Chloroflexi bacterium]|nr:YfhL family 4Fe-4S dicluster ferredoxin [Chloroflexota bacterium]
MAYKITEDCIACGACAGACPNMAISQDGVIYVVDPTQCTECVGFYESSQCAAVCPVDACIPDPDHNETREQLREKWYRLHPTETPRVI